MGKIYNIKTLVCHTERQRKNRENFAKFDYGSPTGNRPSWRCCAPRAGSAVAPRRGASSTRSIPYIPEVITVCQAVMCRSN